MNPFYSPRKGKDSASTAPPGLSQPKPKKGELEEDIWPRIEEARDDPFQMTNRGWTDSCYHKEEIIRNSLLYTLL